MMLARRNRRGEPLPTRNLKYSANALMINVPTKSNVVPLGFNRRMPISQNNEAADAAYWAAQIEAVARLRDPASFMRIYDHFAPRLQRYLSGLLQSQPVAEELMQEAMLRVWTRADSYDPSRSNLVTWIFRIARNLYVDRARSEPTWAAIQEGIDQLDSEHAAFGMSSTETFNDEMRLLDAINSLPALQARLIRMSYLEAKSHSELASELCMPLGSVKSALRRAFGKLQLAMRKPS